MKASGYNRKKITAKNMPKLSDKSTINENPIMRGKKHDCKIAVTQKIT